MVTKRSNGRSNPQFGGEPGSTPPRFSRRISAGQFKARCLALMDEVCAQGGEYVITKRGEPVAKLVAAAIEPMPLLGSMKGTVKTRGDIVSPLSSDWEALNESADEP